jgi:hypothetical protein
LQNLKPAANKATPALLRKLISRARIITGTATVKAVTARTVTARENSQPRRGRGRPRKNTQEGASKPEQQQTVDKKPAAKKSDDTNKPKDVKSDSGDKKTRSNKADETAQDKGATASKKAPVRKKRASKKRTTAKKPTEGNLKAEKKAAPVEVDGNR